MVEVLSFELAAGNFIDRRINEILFGSVMNREDAFEFLQHFFAAGTRRLGQLAEKTLDDLMVQQDFHSVVSACR